MRNLRRSPSRPRRASEPRDPSRGPVPWNRRMEEARQARAQVLAARAAGQGGEAGPDAAAAATPAGAGAVYSTEAEAARGDTSEGRGFPWLVVGGCAFAAAAGVLLISFLVLGPAPLPEEPSGAEEQAARSAGMEPEGAAGGVEATAEDLAESLPEPRAAVTEERGAAPTEAEAVEAGAGGEPGVAESAEAGPEVRAGAAASEATASVMPQAAQPQAETTVAGSEPEVDDERAQPSDGGGEAAAELVEDAPDDAAPADATGAEEPPAGSAGSAEEAAADTDAAVNAALLEAAEAADAGAGDDAEDAPSAAPNEGAEAEAFPGGDEAPVQEGGAVVRVHAAPNVTDEAMEEAVQRLADAGHTVSGATRVGFRISRTNVRYYHEEDAEEAADVAEAVSGVSRDFTSYTPSPEPGTIEVWLGG